MRCDDVPLQGSQGSDRDGDMADGECGHDGCGDGDEDEDGVGGGDDTDLEADGDDETDDDFAPRVVRDRQRRPRSNSGSGTSGARSVLTNISLKRTLCGTGDNAARK